MQYPRITCNKFPNGLFKCVREVSLFDQRPFEYEFFIRIAKAFPLLEKLSVSNKTPQQQKLINNNNKHLSIIEYPHLIELNFIYAHDDYIEQFLINTKTFLPNHIHFCIVIGNSPFLESLLHMYNGSNDKGSPEVLVIACHWILVHQECVTIRNGYRSEILQHWVKNPGDQMVIEYCDGVFQFKLTFVVKTDALQIHSLGPKDSTTMPLPFTKFIVNNG